MQACLFAMKTDLVMEAIPYISYSGEKMNTIFLKNISTYCFRLKTVLTEVFIYNFLNKNDNILTHWNNNKKRPVYTLLKHKQRLIDKQISSKLIIDKIKEINFKHIQNPVKHPRQSLCEKSRKPKPLAIFANSPYEYLTICSKHDSVNK